MTENGAPPRPPQGSDGGEAHLMIIEPRGPQDLLKEEPMTHEMIAETSQGTAMGTVIVTAASSRIHAKQMDGNDIKQS